jgi:hypothetical protein
LPAWAQPLPKVELDVAGDDEFGEAPIPRPVQEVRTRAECDNFLPHAIASPGFCHSTHNIEATLDAHLQEFSKWLPGFRNLCTALRRNDVREEFIERCLKPTGLFPNASSVFRRQCPSTPQWRWGHMRAACRYILKRRQFLQQGWDARKLLEGKAKTYIDDADADGGKLDVRSIERNVRDPFFWGYLSMLLVVHALPAGLRTWSEDCACHHMFDRSWLQDANESDEEQEVTKVAAEEVELYLEIGPSASRDFDGHRFRCPMRGKRALEVAQGAIDELLKDLGCMCETRILRYNAGMPKQDVDRIVADFHRAKSFLHLECQRQFGFWQRLPWSIVLLANPNEDVAREDGRRLVAEFDCSAQQPELHHPVTWEVFHADSPIRQQLNAFVDGAPMGNVLLLQCKVSRKNASSFPLLNDCRKATMGLSTGPSAIEKCLDRQ